MLVAFHRCPCLQVQHRHSGPGAQSPSECGHRGPEQVTQALGRGPVLSSRPSTEVLPTPCPPCDLASLVWPLLLSYVSLPTGKLLWLGPRQGTGITWLTLPHAHVFSP